MNKIQKCTFAAIHAIILTSRNLNEAAGTLGVGDSTLSRHLGRFHHEDAPLTYGRLKALSEMELRASYGDAYDAPIVASDGPTVSGHKRGRPVMDEDDVLDNAAYGEGIEDDESEMDGIVAAGAGKRSRTTTSEEEESTATGKSITLGASREGPSPLAELLAREGLFGRRFLFDGSDLSNLEEFWRLGRASS